MTYLLDLVAVVFGGAVWATVGAMPIARRLTWRPALLAFALLAFSVSALAFLEAGSLLATQAGARRALLAGQASAVTLTSLFLLFFAKWTVHTRRRSDLLLVLPAIALLLLGGSLLIADVAPTEGGFAPTWNRAFYIPWLLYVHAYVAAGFAFLWRGASRLDEDFPLERRNLLLILAVGLALLVYSDLGSPIVSQLASRPVPLSAVFFLPGLVLLATVVPITREGISSFVRRVTKAGREILHAFLIYHGGSLIAHRSLEGESVPDEDLFSAVLEALQQALKVTGPSLGGAWMDAIHQGELKVLMERGQYCFILLVTTGREDDLLRGEMHDLLTRFEQSNASVLADWHGDPDALHGRQETVDFFFDLNRVF